MARRIVYPLRLREEVYDQIAARCSRRGITVRRYLLELLAWSGITGGDLPTIEDLVSEGRRDFNIEEK